MPSPQFRINGGAVGVKASVSAGGAVSATLDSTDGVRSVTWSIIGTDETTTAGNYTLVQSGSVGQTVSFTAGIAGTAGILRAEINGGQNLQTEQADSTTRATAKWYVPTGGGGEVGCVNEGTESDSAYGWTGIVNYGVRGSAASAVPTSRTLTAGAGLTGGGDLSANRTFTVGQNADGSIVVNADDIQVGVLATDAQHGARGGGTQHSAATITANGFMSATDKAKVDAGWILTRAAVESITDPADNTMSYCAEVDAHYLFVFGDSTTVDDWTVLTGDGGRWHLQGDRIAISPLGDSLDDAPRVEEALAACAYRAWVELLPGHWIWDTVCDVPSGASLRGSPDTHIDASLTPSGGAPTESVLYAAGPAPTVTTQLNGATVPGTTTITVDDATGLDIGEELAIIASNNVAIYEITGKASNTLTLDRTIVHPFDDNTQVTDFVSPRDIRIEGRGMRIDGTGDAAVVVSGGLRPHVSGLRVTGFSHYSVGFDVGTRGGAVEDCEIDGDAVAISCLNLETNERSVARHIRCTGATQYGITVTGGWGTVVEACECWQNSGSGAGVSSGFGDSGVQAAAFIGCKFVDNTAHGMEILNGSSQVSVIGCEAKYNGSTGFFVNDGNGPAHDVHFSGCISESNQTGFYAVTDTYGITLSGCSTRANSLYGIACQGELRAVNCVLDADVTEGFYAFGAGYLDVIGATLTAPSTGAWDAFRQEGTSRIDALSVVADLTSSSGIKACVQSVSSGVTHLTNVRTIAGDYGVFTTTGIVIRGPGVDFSSITLANQMAVSGSGAEASASYGTLNVRNAATIPGSNPASGVILYAEGGLLKSRESGGQIAQLGNGGSWTVTSVKTGTYAAVVGELIRCDPSGGGFTVNLPTAVGIGGRSICIKNVTSSTNTITADGNSSETIDGLATQPFATAFGSYTLTSDNANWMVT